MSTTNHVNVTRTLQNLKDEIHPENYEAVKKFIDHQAAEGISEVEQERQIQSLKTLLTKFTPEGFRFRGASKDELKQVLARLNRVTTPTPPNTSSRAPSRSSTR